MKGRGLLIGLIVSAALNLFLIGAAAGVIALGAHMAHSGPARPGPALHHAAMALSPAHRVAFFARLREVGRATRPTAQQARRLRWEAWATAGAQPFDAAAAKARLRQARALDQQARTQVEEAMVDFAATLPPAERAAFAAAMHHTPRQARLPPPGEPPEPPPHP